MDVWKNRRLLSFTEAVADFASGRSTPRELLENCIDRIGKDEPVVRAFVCMDLETARRSADESTQRYKRGHPLSPVDGCPIGIKDIISTQGLPTQMGSPAFKGWRSLGDAACVHALRTGGAVIVGKTVTTEFAIGLSRETTNPFDPERTPGGSSSGSGAAVGAGMVPIALGTQTQSSTIRPASYCGAYGFKPSHGRLRMEGVHLLSPTSDHLGIIGANLDDIWRIASRIALSVGSAGREFMHRAGPLPEASKPQALLRLFTRGWDEMDPDSRSSFDALVADLQRRGISIVSKDEDPKVAALEAALERNIDSALDIVGFEMQWPFCDYLARYGEVIGPRIHAIIERASRMTRARYGELLNMRQALARQMSQVLKAVGADAAILPASSGPAPVGLEYAGSRTYPSFATLIGFPSFALPLLSAQGLPFGVQLFGAVGRDGDLCATARWVDRAYGN